MPALIRGDPDLRGRANLKNDESGNRRENAVLSLTLFSGGVIFAGSAAKKICGHIIRLGAFLGAYSKL